MKPELTRAIALGVAGNFAGHLEQAVQNIDFGKVEVKEPDAPKGVFPVYVPSNTGRFFEAYPFSSDLLSLPHEGAKVKIEPEVALLCDIRYDGAQVTGLTPLSFAAFNDCSMHGVAVNKISEKKNWGAASKGVSNAFVEIDHFHEGGVMDRYRLACYLQRDGELHAYGVDSAVRDYSYFHEKLIGWLIEKMNTQQDVGPFEDIGAFLEMSGFPTQALIAIGATRYTDFGEDTFLQEGDESIVVVYDAAQYDARVIEQRLTTSTDEGSGLSVLRQTVISGFDPGA